MTLTNITIKEEEEFKKLQKQGMLPSAAVERLEIERKLEMVSPLSTDRLNLKENWWFYLSAGTILFTILYIYSKSGTTTPPVTIPPTV